MMKQISKQESEPRLERRFGERGEWYVVVQFILLGSAVLAPLYAWPLAQSQPWLTAVQLVGLLFLMLGIGIVNAGLLSLGLNNLTALPYPRRRAQLVEQGAYRWVRHPIYTGIIVGALGWGLLMNSLPGVLVAVVLYIFFDRKSRQEEQWLRQKYPGYAAYQQQVGRLLPGLGKGNGRSE
jgi:protein-S-isoprenylcysteine O-methyltransferase Ste14